MNPASATGAGARVPVLPFNQPPVPDGPAPANPPLAPQLGNVPAADDPRGTKRAREEDDGSDNVASSEPVVKQARTEPAPEPVHPAQEALFNAIDAGDTASVARLIKHFPMFSGAQYPGPLGETPLCRAARTGATDIVLLLCNSGVLVNACARNGATPLMFAAEAGHTEVIRALVQRGASVNLVSLRPHEPQVAPRVALADAVCQGHVEASKCLIELGADFQQVLKFGDEKVKYSVTPLRYAVRNANIQLIAWLLDTGKLHVESTEASTQMTLVNLAARHGISTMVRYFIVCGANLDAIWTDQNGRRRCGGVWDIALEFQKAYVIEDLLRHGLRPSSLREGMDAFIRNVVQVRAADMVLHVPLLRGNVGVAPDGLADDSLREQPHRALESLAAKGFVTSTDDPVKMSAAWLSTGLSGLFITGLKVVVQRPAVLGNLCGKGFDSSASGSRLISTAMQQLQIVIEHVSDACGNPVLFAPFSDMGLTENGEQVMNQMITLQTDLMLHAIAHLRDRFDRQVASLPDLCMDTYISRSHRLNEADLYRVLTEDWGLYAPIARAVLRLVKEAYARLRESSSGNLPLPLAVLSPAEQLKAAITTVLEDWDKIPEIVETIAAATSPESMDVVADFLFQQWRLFCEALGVTKERYLSIGPRRREEVGVELITGDEPS